MAFVTSQYLSDPPTKKIISYWKRRLLMNRNDVTSDLLIISEFFGR